ncbi:Nucleotide-binding protein OS=Streptomyces tendae OX=1932 GN=GUR47_18405 PE=4 SV=1 [Streptomyces tendae]
MHGRDDQVRREVYELLRRLDLRPKEWEDLVRATGQASPFLGDVVAAAPAQAQAALVLLTPDDVVTLHPQLRGHNEPDHETRPVCQPRPNVLIELGMVLMAYPERTLIVEVGGVRPIADIAGRNVIRFDGSETALGKVVERLKLAGCTVNDTGSDWRQTYPFRHLSAYHRRP